MSDDASKTIAIAGDHGGIELKSSLMEMLVERGFEILDLGTGAS